MRNLRTFGDTARRKSLHFQPYNPLAKDAARRQRLRFAGFFFAHVLGGGKGSGGGTVGKLGAWKLRRFPSLFGGGSADATVEGKKAQIRRKNSTLEREYLRLLDSQSEILYLVAGEDAATAKEMLFWGIGDFYAAQAAQQKILKERAEAAERANKKR